MDTIELGVLGACEEYVLRQREMLPHLAASIGVEERQVFYTLAGRSCAQRGRLNNADWTYFIHGMECDLKNQRDGRFLRMDFGPGGSVGNLDGGGVLRLIMTSVSPWREFPELKTYFKKNGPPFDEFSGDWQKMVQTWQSLEKQGFFEMADKDLVDLLTKYTSRGADGLSYVRYPPEISEETKADFKVAHRQRLSSRAIQVLKSHASDSNLRLQPVREISKNEGSLVVPK